MLEFIGDSAMIPATSKQRGFCCLGAKTARVESKIGFVGIPHHGFVLTAQTTCLLVTTGKVMRDSCIPPAFLSHPIPTSTPRGEQ
jgi:hypothetical protein